MNYTLLVKVKQSPKVQELLDKLLPDHKCESCETKEFCPLINIKIIADGWIVAKNDDFNEIKKIIKKEFENANMIIVMENPADICHIFKAEGELTEIKKSTLKESLVIYEKIEKTHVFFPEIRDLRGEPIIIEKKKKTPPAAEEKQ